MGACNIKGGVCNIKGLARECNIKGGTCNIKGGVYAILRAAYATLRDLSDWPSHLPTALRIFVLSSFPLSPALFVMLILSSPPPFSAFFFAHRRSFVRVLL
jgi:hypothetical protein